MTGNRTEVLQKYRTGALQWGRIPLWGRNRFTVNTFGVLSHLQAVVLLLREHEFIFPLGAVHFIQ